MSPPRILIVEDEGIVVLEIRHRLGRLGYEVAGVADTAEQAVRLAEEHRPDLVLMDIRLRDDDGVTAAEEIARRCGSPVVFLTAHADEATLRRAGEVGPSGYLLKPFQEQDLQVAIEIALRRHRAEKELRRNEHRYATMLASIADAVIAADADGRVSYLNPVAESLTGWAAAEARGRPFAELVRLVDGRTGAPAEDPVALVLDTGRPAHTHNALLTARDGRRALIDDSAAPIHEDGQLVGVVFVFRDVTRQRELEGRAREAQRLDAIGQLAGGVAHDFNNLLTVISGYLGLLREALATGSEGALAYLEPIDLAQQRAAALTRQLLAFGRRQLLRPVLVDLNEAVRSLAARMAEGLGEGVERVMDLAAEPLTVKVDREQLDHVLRDLITNAREAMSPEAGDGPAAGRLTLTTREAVVGEGEDIPPGRYHAVSVRDTGRGMDEATRARVFEPFFTTKQVGRGSGLGLASAYGAMKQSGGHIRVESAPGRGATFTLYFLPAPPAAGPAREGAPGGATADLPHGNETVLLVEDEGVVRALVGQVLRMSGYTVLEADDGPQALEVLGGHAAPIHLLVSDVLMPQLNGPELARRVTAQRPGIRVLFLSGYPETELVDMDLLHTGQPLLTKPFTPTELARKVREVLDAAPPGRG